MVKSLVQANRRMILGQTNRKDNNIIMKIKGKNYKYILKSKCKYGEHSKTLKVDKLNINNGSLKIS